MAKALTILLVSVLYLLLPNMFCAKTSKEVVAEAEGCIYVV